MGQVDYIVGIIKGISVQTELLELLDWDELELERLLALISRTVNNKKTTSLIQDVSKELERNGYSDVVVKFISEYLCGIMPKKEVSYDC